VSGLGLHAGEDTGAPPPRTGSVRAASYAYVDVEPGVSKLYTLQPGRVVKIAAHDNDEVEKDAPLILLDDTVAKADLERARAGVAAAETALNNAKAHAKLLNQEHAAKITGQKAAVTGKKAELEDAMNKRDKAKDLAGKGVGVSQKDVAVAEINVTARELALTAEEEALRALEDYNPEIASKVPDAEAQLKDKKELFKKAEWALRECTIMAPEKGTVLRVMVAEGDVLGPNPHEPAVVFCPDKPHILATVLPYVISGPSAARFSPDKVRILRAEVEQEFASRLSLNQTALVRDDSTNSPLMTGKVTRISDWYSHRRSMVQEPLQLNDVRTVECIITLDPNDKTPLRLGQRVRVMFEGN
jgi:multidrug efflux pump subunit AcrA (membrane-fusion protein)